MISLGVGSQSILGLAQSREHSRPVPGMLAEAQGPLSCLIRKLTTSKGSQHSSSPVPRDPYKANPAGLICTAT